MPRRSAVATARSDGADTAQRKAMPAIAAFCTISKLARPLTSSSFPWSGSSPASAIAPTSLSSALCRPTSSRSAMSCPSPVKSAAAWSPPVDEKTAWASRMAAGSPTITDGATSGPATSGSQRRSMSSMEALPQIPQLAVATNARLATSDASNGPASRTVISFSGCDVATRSASSKRAPRSAAGPNLPSPGTRPPAPPRGPASASSRQCPPDPAPARPRGAGAALRRPGIRPVRRPSRRPR